MEHSLLHVEKGLEYSFLYECDAESIHILLSMLEHRCAYPHLRLSYVLMRRIITSIKRVLKHRKDRDYILVALRRSLDDDLKRFEMAVHLNAYMAGYHNAQWLNAVEYLALQELSPEALSSGMSLLHLPHNTEVQRLKANLFYELKERTGEFQELKELSTAYARNVLRKKIYSINDHIDQQLVIDWEDPRYFKVEENYLTILDMNRIYNKCNQALYRTITKVYKNAFWEGINDAVLERYS